MVEPEPLPGALESGYRRFRDERYPADRDRYLRLGHDGQHPAAMVIACSDSRAAPEAVFDAAPGEIFVLRNVAALVPRYTPDGAARAASAALEYAVLALRVPSIVVMGHGRCGGIGAAVSPEAPLSATDFVGAWVADLRRIADDVDPEIADRVGRVRALEYRSVEQSLRNLRTFPWIADRERAGALRLHGAWFDILLGELHVRTAGGWEVVPSG